MIAPVVIVTSKYSLKSFFLATLNTRRLLLKKWLITVPNLKPDLITVIRDDRSGEKGLGRCHRLLPK